MIQQVMHRMGKAARQKLLLQIHREKPRAGVDVFVACHPKVSRTNTPWSLAMTNRSPQNADFGRFFYSLVIQKMANLMIFVLFLSTLGLVLFCCFSAYLGLSSRSWPHTKGTVLSSQLVERKNSASSSKQVYYHPLVIYEYAIGQKSINQNVKALGFLLPPKASTQIKS